MRVKILVAALIFLIVVNLATIGTYVYLKLAQSSEEERHGMPPGRMPPPIAQLNEDQRQKIFGLMRGFQEETRNLQLRVRSLEDSTFRLIQETSVERDKVDERLREIAGVRLEISKKAAQKMIEAKSFLTPEQQKHFFDAIMQVRPEHPGGRPPEGMPHM